MTAYLCVAGSWAGKWIDDSQGSTLRLAPLLDTRTAADPAHANQLMELETYRLLPVSVSATRIAVWAPEDLDPDAVLEIVRAFIMAYRGRRKTDVTSAEGTRPRDVTRRGFYALTNSEGTAIYRQWLPGIEVWFARGGGSVSPEGMRAAGFSICGESPATVAPDRSQGHCGMEPGSRPPPPGFFKRTGRGRVAADCDGPARRRTGRPMGCSAGRG